MRPRLRPDFFYVPTEHGVQLINDRVGVELNGKGLHEWLDRLTPHLDGARTLAELTIGVSREHRAVLKQLVDVLLDKGFARDASGDLPHSLTAEELTRYESEISLIEHYADSPERRFQRYRESNLVLVGSGLTFTHLASAAVHSGARKVVVRVTGEAPTDVAVLDELGVKWSYGDDVSGADAVLHISDRPMPGRVLALHRACADIPLCHAIVRDDTAWIGTFTDGWALGWRQFGTFDDEPDAAVSQFLAGPAAAVVANHVSLACFRQLTGIGDDDAITEISLLDLATRKHAVGRDLLTVFGAFDEDYLTQLPVRLSSLTVGGQRIIGAGADLASARRDTAVRALRAHVSSETSGPDFMGTSLLDGRAVPVPAAVLDAPGPGVAPDVRSGLADHCRAFVANAISHGTLDLANAKLGQEASQLRDIAFAAGIAAPVENLTPVLGVPAFRFGPTAVGADATVDDAVCHGLLELLRAHQLGTLLPAAPAKPGSSWPKDPSRDPVKVLAEALARQGKRPVVVPLDHDPVLAGLAVRVVLLDG